MPECVALSSCPTVSSSAPHDVPTACSSPVAVAVLQVGVSSDISWRRPRAPPCWSACEGRMSSESGVAAARLPSPPTGMTALRCSLGLLLLLLPLSVAPARLPTAPPTGRNCSCTKATAPCSDWFKNFECYSSPAPRV